VVAVSAADAVEAITPELLGLNVHEKTNPEIGLKSTKNIPALRAGIFFCALYEQLR
jgi:hypothetical protein